MIDDSDNNKKYSPDENPQDPGYYAPPEDRYDDLAPQDQAPAVSAPAAKNFVFIGLLGILVIAAVFFLFGSDDKPAATPSSNGTAPVISAKPTPAIIPPPQPIPAPEPPPVASEPVEADTTNTALFPEENPDRQRRIQSSLLITSGGFLGSTNLGGGNQQGGANSLTEVNDNDPSVGFADRFYNQPDAPFAQARKLGDTSRLITQGKIIESILETPINTDVPGMIRAIVSRDIYAESGRAILIPKGSRLVGTYNNFVIRGNKRVNVIWSRVIRPDGIDIMIRSGATDQLGRAGIEGEVDNKYAEIFASAFLVSAINIAVAAGVDEIDPSRYSETTNTDGSTTRNTNAKQEAAIRAVDMFGNAGQNLIDGFLNLKPTITIDQGTRVNVFVNRDLIFPTNVVGQVKFIQ